MEQSNLAKLISNYGSRLWSMVSVFVFIPLYIKFLGSDNYGLIGFYALLLGIISFADSGMSSAVIKEFSQESTANYKYTVLRKLEFIYIAICASLCLIIFVFADLIVDYWIKSDTISKENLVYYVRLIGVGVSTQLVSTLYFGSLFALNSQVKSNMLQFLWSFSRSALVFLLFIVFSKSIEVYFIWQIVCNVLYVLFLRYFTILQLKTQSLGIALSMEFKKLPSHIKSYIGGMVFIAIISAINIQADKLVTSSMFNLSTFGFYNIASSLAQIPLIFAAPLMAFAFPLFSKFSNFEIENNREKNLIVFNKVFYLINLVVAVATIAIFLYAKDILVLWTKNAIPQSIFSAITFDVKILITGTFFLALQFPLYYLLLSKGKTKYTIYQGIVQLVIGLPLLYFFTKKFGLYGIPIPWLLINFASFIFLFVIVSKRYLHFVSFSFFKNILLGPIIITLIINFLVYSLYKITTFNFIAFFFLASLLSVLFSVMFFNKANKQGVLTYKHLYNFPHE